MGNHPIGKIINRIRRSFQPRDVVEPTDGQLLDRFIETGDEGAFEWLVRRHGAMVLGVCRRTLHDHHNAEDAFQATFLVLARKATSIRHRDLVASWLYGVAFQTARRARMSVCRRSTREKQVMAMPEPQVLPAEVNTDLMPLLDEELSRLPEKYRLPLVLCDLEGKGHAEAARQLGWPQGTVSGRLSRARKLLARRLTRRGISVSAIAVGIALAEQASAASLPTSLVGSTVKAAGCIAAGKALAGAVSTKVAALTDAAVKSLLLSKLKVTVSAGLVLTVLTFGAGLARRALAPTDTCCTLIAAAAAADAPASTGSSSNANEVTPPNQVVEMTFDGLEFTLVPQQDRSVIGLLRDNLTHAPFVPPNPAAEARGVAFRGAGLVFAQKPRQNSIQRLFHNFQHAPFVPAREAGADVPQRDGANIRLVGTLKVNLQAR
jgi:RNA polymerase sigma factor (sigma-70 family)